MRSSTETVAMFVNGKKIEVAEKTSVAVAVLKSGAAAFRTSVSGEPRGPLCGMGICLECRVTINGVRNCRSCQICCESGMEVITAG
jgi:hypothetical protein